MERLLYCPIHSTRPVEYVCLACGNLRMCEKCKLAHVNEEGHAPESCKEVGLALMHQHLEDAGGRQAKELTKGLRGALRELETGFLGEIDRFLLSLTQTEEQRKMQELINKGRYAELYLYAKRLPMGGANTGDAMRRLNKRLLKMLNTTYEGLEKVRNKIAADAGETLAEKIARMEKDMRNLTDILEKKEESLRNCMTACKASITGFKTTFEENTAGIDKQQDIQKKMDMIKELGGDLNKVENGFDSALAELSAPLGTKAAEIREFRRVLDSKAEEVNQRIGQVANKIPKMEEELKKLTDLLQDSEEGRKSLAEILQNSEESLKSCLAACDAREFNEMFKESPAAIDKQELRKKKDMIKKLGDRLNAVENGFDSAMAKFNAQLGTKAAGIREFRRVLDAKGEEVNKRIAEEEKKKSLSVEKSECALIQCVAEMLLAGYTWNYNYTDVNKAYKNLVSNSESDPVTRTVMLIYYYRSFAHPCGLELIGLDECGVDYNGATIIACGLKLSTRINELYLCKKTPIRL